MHEKRQFEGRFDFGNASEVALIMSTFSPPRSLLAAASREGMKFRASSGFPSPTAAQAYVYDIVSIDVAGTHTSCLSPSRSHGRWSCTTSLALVSPECEMQEHVVYIWQIGASHVQEGAKIEAPQTLPGTSALLLPLLLRCDIAFMAGRTCHYMLCKHSCCGRGKG